MLFRPTLEVGPLRLGKWKHIKSPKYISVFNSKTGYEINLWHHKNNHLELYKRANYKDALRMAFEISENLNIELLDATRPNNSRWIDKAATKKAKTIIYKD